MFDKHFLSNSVSTVASAGVLLASEHISKNSRYWKKERINPPKIEEIDNVKNKITSQRSISMGVLRMWLCCASLLFLSTLMADEHSSQNELHRQCCPRAAGVCPSFRVGGDAVFAFDYFRSLPEGSWTGNFGALTGFNLAVGLPREKYGIGVQVGGSYGLYDWDGRGSNITGNHKALQQQGFLTVGFFRVTPYCSGFNGGIVYDAMFNKYFGVFALNPILGQLRAQMSYLIQGRNELGVWGTVDTQTSHKETSEIPVKFRAVCQANLFWTYYFKNRAQTSVWVGTPYRRGLMFTSGRAGRYIVGASFKAPLTQAWSVVGHATYMAAQSDPGAIESRNFAANVCFGINYSFGGCKAGQRPYLPLADNGNFIADTNLNE